MEIALHIGVHCTDNDQLLECLLHNREALAEAGIVVPAPHRYRPAIRDTIGELKGDPANQDTQELLLDTIIDEDAPKRIILSHEGFLCVPRRTVGNEALYPVAGQKVARLRNLFGKHNVQIFMGLRNPATFLPAVYARTKAPDFDNFLAGADPMTLRWSSMIARMRTSAPDTPIIVWCNEDTPLIWPQILNRLVGSQDPIPLEGVNAFLGTIMGKGGLNRLEAYLKTHTPKTEEQRQRIVAAFLDKFAAADRLEDEIDLPGWSASYVDQMTALYDKDIELIERMPGVTYLTP